MTMIKATQEVYSDRALYRSIPGYPRYWCSPDGVVIHKLTLAREVVCVFDGVPHVEVPRTVAGTVRPWTPLDILVARAWVPIPRPLYRHREVVHIDGDPLNCNASNLAWKKAPRDAERRRQRTG